jgi:O-antigen/teichoic acid export membrane protein
MEPARLLESAYRFVSGEEPTARVRKALQQFPIYAVGTVIARVLSFLAQLYVARRLGPAQFGRFSLCLAIATLLTIPMQASWGTAFVRFAVVRMPGSSPWPMLRAAMVLTTLSSGVVVLLALMAAPLLTSVLDVSASTYLLGVATAVTTTVWLFAKSSCQGLQAWNRLVMIELGWAALIFIGPLYLSIVDDQFDWRIINLFSAAYVVASVPALSYWLASATGPVRPHLHRQWRFGRLLLGANLIAALPLSADRFLVNASTGLHGVGVYQAYALSTVGVATFAATLLSRFLFPLLNLGQRAAFLRLFRRTLPRAGALYVLSTFVLGWLALWFSRYPFYPGMLAIAVVSGFALCVVSFLSDLASTDEQNGPRVVLSANLVACAVFFPVTWLLLPRYQIVAPFIAFTIAFGAAAAFIYAWAARLEREQ